jgi:ABC-type transport system substrate-binding protein
VKTVPAVRRALVAAALAVTAAVGGATATTGPGAEPANGPKVLRYAFRIAETGFDPAQVSDLYSSTINANIFEAPLELEFLARPVRLRPNTLAAMPEVSADFKTFTFTLKPGIYFADDPAFRGVKRELVAADYVYSLKRIYDPKTKSPHLYSFENAGVLGLSELRREAIAARKPFDYDREVEGAQVLDRYRFRLRIAKADPRFVNDMSSPSVMGAVAREVVEFYGDRITEHPVGTGPYMLKEWRRGSRIVLERNPGYRTVVYQEEPPAEDPVAQAAAAAMRGKTLPPVDRVEVSIIDENQPRWLAFLNGEQDVIEEVPPEYADIAMPNAELAPNLAKRGIRMVRYQRADVSVSYFQMEHPVVGGYTPEKVALRRAIALAVDVDKEIRLVRKGQAIPAQGPIGPGTWGYDRALRTEMGEHNLPRAKALLDLYGYVDRDGDGWRDLPDGSPLVLEYASQPDQYNRSLTEQWKTNMDALGVRIEFRIAKWPENMKAARAGKLMMWGLGWSVGNPDGEGFLELGYGPNKGQSNYALFDLPAFNAAYDRQKELPNGPERQAAMDEAQKLMVAYMPYKIHVHRVYTDLAQPWVLGYDRNVFLREFWKYVDIDRAELARQSQ